MSLSILLRAIAAGFLIAAPVGPVNMLCIRRTLTEGRRAGFISGLGAAVADALYGFVAAFGIRYISDVLLEHQFWLQMIGGFFICFLGVKTFFAEPAETKRKISTNKHAGNFISAFILTLTNPTTILSFGLIFAWLGLTNIRESRVATETMVLGVFLGSSLWWLILSLSVGIWRMKLKNKPDNKSEIRWVNRVSGILITIFGVITILLF